ncbi:hypothetical protein JST97_33200 [bacterium]|nr:hypothetical protein [bacterium]
MQGLLQSVQSLSAQWSGLLHGNRRKLQNGFESLSAFYGRSRERALQPRDLPLKHPYFVNQPYAAPPLGAHY